jgi:hypothetical protein
MKLLNTLFESRVKVDSLFEEQKGKTLAEYQQELLIKMGKRQFEKLEDLGLAFPIQLA